MGETKEVVYNGKPLMEFQVSNKTGTTTYPIRVGVTKIKAVLDNIENCKDFVEKHAGIPSKKPF